MAKMVTDCLSICVISACADGLVAPLPKNPISGTSRAEVMLPNLTAKLSNAFRVCMARGQPLVGSIVIKPPHFEPY